MLDGRQSVHNWHFQVHDDAVELPARGCAIRRRDFADLLKSLQTVIGHYQISQSFLRSYAQSSSAMGLALGSKTDVFQLTVQDSLVNQVILDNQHMRSRTC